jgi:hypothetical protein
MLRLCRQTHETFKGLGPSVQAWPAKRLWCSNPAAGSPYSESSPKAHQSPIHQVRRRERKRVSVKRYGSRLVYFYLSIIRNVVNCEFCRRKLIATEPIWRFYGFNGRRDSLSSICDDCFLERNRFGAENYWEKYLKSELTRWRDPSPCAHCGRPVRIRRRYKLRLVVCGVACRQAIYNARARARRVLPKRACQNCGEFFTPSRSDGRFCSVGCKQSAYRQRVGARVAGLR